MRVAGKHLEVSDAVRGAASLKGVLEGEAAQRRVPVQHSSPSQKQHWAKLANCATLSTQPRDTPARAAAVDAHLVAIYKAAARQILRRTTAVRHVRYAPLPLEALAVRPPVARRTRVVNVRHGVAAGRPKLRGARLSESRLRAVRGARGAARAWIARFSAADVEAVGPPCDFTRSGGLEPGGPSASPLVGG